MEKANAKKPKQEKKRYKSDPNAPLSPNGIKTGRLSLEEMDYMRDNIDNLSSREISTYLNRPIETVIAYKDKLISKGKEKLDALRDLTREADWQILKQQFSKIELDKFKLEYSNLIAQFNNDVQATEKQQVLHVIKLSILMDRILIDKQKMVDERARIENAKSMIMEAGIDEEDPKSKLEQQSLIENLSTQIRSLEAGVRDLTKEYTGYLEKHSKLLSDLKATRDKRLDKIEKPGETFQDLVEYLKQEEVQAHDSRRATLIEKAVKKEKARLMSEYTFADGNVDYILLTDETPIAAPVEVESPEPEPAPSSSPLQESPSLLTSMFAQESQPPTGNTDNQDNGPV